MHTRQVATQVSISAAWSFARGLSSSHIGELELRSPPNDLALYLLYCVPKGRVCIGRT